MRRLLGSAPSDRARGSLLWSPVVSEQEGPYNIHSEQSQETSKCLEQLLRGIKISETLSGLLQSFSIKQGSEIGHLRDEAQRLANFHTIDKRIIALLGDSGEG